MKMLAIAGFSIVGLVAIGVIVSEIAKVYVRLRDYYGDQ